jgi:hypothetical protein
VKGFDSKNIPVESNVDDEGMDMQIDAEDMGFVYDLLFSQMYRDPIGSVIREITSNCFDSHVEANVTDAVVITLGEDLDSGHYITFQDFGVGLSPERMEKVYRKPAKSTKRDTNGQIGYFGLGSKSPLSYDDSFFLTTVSDGVKYEYIVHKGEKAPRIEKLSEEETTERNGTVVKIYIKNTSDFLSFQKKVPTQLRYFDNVYVKGAYYFKNNYKLFEGKNFKFRDDVDLSEDLHICIGKVTYPIDWSKLNRPPIKLPLGLKFNIGDLPITPERESVRYIIVERDGEEVNTADIINAKIEELLKEVLELESLVIREHNNLEDYYEHRNDKSYIELLDCKIDTSYLVKDRKHVYQPLYEVGIDLPNNPFFGYEIFATIKTKKIDVGVRRLNQQER